MALPVVSGAAAGLAAGHQLLANYNPDFDDGCSFIYAYFMRSPWVRALLPTVDRAAESGKKRPPDERGRSVVWLQVGIPRDDAGHSGPHPNLQYAVCQRRWAALRDAVTLLINNSIAAAAHHNVDMFVGDYPSQRPRNWQCPFARYCWALSYWICLLSNLVKRHFEMETGNMKTYTPKSDMGKTIVALFLLMR